MKIIVVDDEPIIADTLVDILTGEGYEAVALSDGASAIKWARMIEPDVVISDVIMPNINGIDTAKEILKIRPQCRIILFSGQAASIDLLEEAKREGFQFEVLAKPINPDRLLAILDEKRYSAAKT
jgi:DNA-binding NtrC family response regulator